MCVCVFLFVGGMYVFSFGVLCIAICFFFYAFIRFVVIFCIYENILKMFFACPRSVNILVFSTGNITGIVGGNYYWYGRR